MRIISGSHKGRNIHVPKTFRHRPTTDIAKEGLFNILFNYIDFDSTEVLDLFSGTGSISYEFASRGTKQIIAVDNNFRNIEFIKKCASDFGMEGIISIKSDVFRFIDSTDKKFDLIFADPPFDLKNLGEIPEKIFSSKILSDNGVLILEHPVKYNFKESCGFQMIRKYGSVNFSFFSKTGFL